MTVNQIMPTVRTRHLTSVSIRLLALMFIAMLVATLAQAQGGQEGAWQKFVPENNLFEVVLPGKPTYKQEEISIGIQLKFHQYSISLVSGHEFLVAYVDYPFSSYGPSGLDNALDGMVRSTEVSGLRLLSHKSIDQGGCNGRDAVFSSESSGYSRARAFQSDNRLYILIYTGNRYARGSEDVARRFLAPFRVTGGCVEGLKPEEAQRSGSITWLEGEPDTSTGWLRIRKPDDEFTVLVPARTSLESQDIQLPFPTTRHRYQSTKGTAVYSIMVIGDLPASMFEKSYSYESTLDIAYREFFQEMKDEGAIVTLVRNMNVGRYPGREYRFNQDTRTGLVQLYSTGKKFYSFMAFDEVLNHPQKNFERFFSSIRLVVK